MNPYAHELRHHLLTATVIGTVVILTLVGVLGGYSVSSPSLAGIQFVYDYADGYHFLVYSLNNQWATFAGAEVQLWINASGSPPTNFAYAEGQTNSSGLVLLSANVPETVGYYLTIHVSSPYYSVGFQYPLATPSPGLAISGVTVDPVSVGFWDTTPSVSVLAMNPGGFASGGLEVRYVVAENVSAPRLNYTEGETILLGTLSGDHHTFPWTVAVNNATGSSVVFEVFAPNGTILESAYLQASSLLPSGLSPAGISAESTLLSAQDLVALLALALAYTRYGKDRSLRTLESVLCRPVTRTKLFLVRFGAVLIALAAGLAMLLGVFDAWAVIALGSGFPPGVILVLYGALVAEGAVFAGLLVLASHLLRSRGGLIGFSAGAFLVATFFFTLVVGVLAVAFQKSYGDIASTAS